MSKVETQHTPKIASQEEWLRARITLLEKEKEHTRAKDALAKERRNLPMVEVTKPYTFTVSSDPDGKTTTKSLVDLFGDKRQLIIYHLMFNPDHEEACSSCSLVADNIAPVQHLASRDTAFYCVSRAPIGKIEKFKERMGWGFPWVSSEGSEFNYDYHATLDASRGPTEYNYKVQESKEGDSKVPPPGEAPGSSVFYRDGDKVYHTYSSYARGLESCIGTYGYLDLTPLGRQEEGSGIQNFKFHDKY